MPPAVSVSDDDASSGGDIPPRMNTKQKGKAKEEEVLDEDEDEELEADVYIVEKIKSHRFEPGGVIKYEVKWQGFSDKDNTWEPEENLDGCIEDLNQYFEKIGGRPTIPEPKAKGTPATGKAGAKKRKTSDGPVTESATPETTTTSGRGRQKKTKLDEVVGSTGASGTKPKWEPPSGSWEDHVVSVDTMEKDPVNGTISAFIMWADGHRSLHPSKVVHQKCPQKMLQFYEAHLQFNTAPAKAEPESMNGLKKEDPMSEDEDEGEGIKGVVSTISDSIKGVASSLAEGFKNIS